MVLSSCPSCNHAVWGFYRVTERDVELRAIAKFIEERGAKIPAAIRSIVDRGSVVHGSGKAAGTITARNRAVTEASSSRALDAAPRF